MDLHFCMECNYCVHAHHKKLKYLLYCMYDEPKATMKYGGASCENFEPLDLKNYKGLIKIFQNTLNERS